MAHKTKENMNFKFDSENVFFTSDTHFNHSNIIRFCQRPFKDVSEMNETLIKNWNSIVGPEDTVFHLRDFCLGGSAEWTNILDRLNGKINLILGNRLCAYRLGREDFTSVIIHIYVSKEGITRIYGNCSVTFTQER